VNPMPESGMVFTKASGTRRCQTQEAIFQGPLGRTAHWQPSAEWIGQAEDVDYTTSHVFPLTRVLCRVMEPYRHKGRGIHTAHPLRQGVDTPNSRQEMGT